MTLSEALLKKAAVIHKGLKQFEGLFLKEEFSPRRSKLYPLRMAPMMIEKIPQITNFDAVNIKCATVINYQFDLTLYLIETPFNAFANRADPDQAALVRAA